MKANSHQGVTYLFIVNDKAFRVNMLWFLCLIYLSLSYLYKAIFKILFPSNCSHFLAPSGLTLELKVVERFFLYFQSYQLRSYLNTTYLAHTTFMRLHEAIRMSMTL